MGSASAGERKSDFSAEDRQMAYDSQLWGNMVEVLENQVFQLQTLRAQSSEFEKQLNRKRAANDIDMTQRQF